MSAANAVKSRTPPRSRPAVTSPRPPAPVSPAENPVALLAAWWQCERLEIAGVVAELQHPTSPLHLALTPDHRTALVADLLEAVDVFDRGFPVGELVNTQELFARLAIPK